MPRLAAILIFLTFFSPEAFTQTGGRPVTLPDVMKILQIKETVFSGNGEWLAVTAVPDRGNKELLIKNLNNGKSYRFDRGESAEFSSTAQHCAFTVPVDFRVAEAKKDKSSLPGCALLTLRSGDTLHFPNGSKAAFSKDGKWFFVLIQNPDTTKPGGKEKPLMQRKRLRLYSIISGQSHYIPDVLEYAADSASTQVAYTTGDTTQKKVSLWVRNLSDSAAPVLADSGTGIIIGSLLWNSDATLAYLSAKLTSSTDVGPARLMAWNGTSKLLESAAPPGWIIPYKNRLKWAKDNTRLFYCFQFSDTANAPVAYDTTVDNFFNPDSIVSKAELDVWHWNDPYIKPHEKKRFKDNKNPLYTQMYDFVSGRTTRIADSTVNETIQNSSHVALGYTNLPYRKEVSWDNYYYDIYAYNLSNGTKSEIAKRLRSLPALSPGGKYALYFDKGGWHLYTSATGQTVNVTKKSSVSFANEENDLPAPPSEYGWGGWMDADSVCFLYDRYDIWAVDCASGNINSITKGRGPKTVYRIVKTEKDNEYHAGGKPLLISAFNEHNKTTSLFHLDMHNGMLSSISTGGGKATFKVKAKNSGHIVFSQERYDIFPDLWLFNPETRQTGKITEYGKQIDSFQWSKARLIEWTTRSGKKLNGVFIEPVNYQKGKRYPVLVYFYEIFSNNLHNFPDMVVNHRPNYPYYAGCGYGIFLPDVKYTVGEPGASAVECLTSGVQKLIDLGIADKNAIGLHGHSWSGYQTAFAVTATDIFAAACAGAPVSNMTSAYSGIRTESGQTRQFQYEKAQSRIGASLWEKKDAYIRNSPLFFADKIHTPLLLMHGDEDEAVPWQQSVEFYMALRRLGKTAYFLQYRGEPHHPKKFPNKVDYSIKMKEFFDHYLLGRDIPKWMSMGVPYKE